MNHGVNLDYRARPIKWSRYHTVAHSCGKDEKMKNKKDAAKPVEDVRTSLILSSRPLSPLATDCPTKTQLSPLDKHVLAEAAVSFLFCRENAASLCLVGAGVQLSVTRDSRFNLALGWTLCSIWARVTWASILPKCYISPSHKQSHDHHQQRKTKHAILALEHNRILVPGVWVKAHPITC